MELVWNNGSVWVRGTSIAKNLGLPSPGTCINNPCNAANGNKFQTETDTTSIGAEGNSVIRYYNSQSAQDIGFGYGWTASVVGGRLSALVTSPGSVQILRADGKGESFTCTSTVCQGETDSHSTLTPDTTGYTLTRNNNASIERFDLSGKLLSETDSSGKTTNYSYDTNGKLNTVTDSFGHIFTFGYDVNGHVSTITDSDGKIIGYSYDASNNLTHVGYPDNTAKIYHYENTSFPNYLTGISYVDSTGVTTRYSTYAYDTNGKAIRTEHAQTDNGAPQEKFTLNYDSATQTTVTDPVGTNEVMTFATNLGVKNLVTKVNSSDGKSVQQVFDGNNNLTCRKDEENRVTTYTYNATNQRTGMTEGLTGNCTSPQNTSVTRITTYQYLSPTLDLPTVISAPSVYSGQNKTTTLQYTDASHLHLPTVITQAGYTPAGVAVSRTVSLGYSASGQANSINGPRTDVNDVTTLEYYECTSGGACGQLRRITNALGHITTYDLYDANGRLTQMTYPNGLVTTYGYDPRGRVKTITRTPASGSAATTQYSYTPWGDVSQVIDPDGVVLNYQYDAAHDLRFIVDAAGNYIHYQYDLKGNKTGENIYDAGGNLKRALGYAYDLRNHLSQVNNAGNVTQLVYDAVGNLTSETDPNNHGTTHQYDALNRLFKTVNALSQETGYAQDINDRPTGVTAPNNLSTQYSYDDLGNLLQENSRDRGTTTYTYDAAGNVLTVTDARSITTTYTYDALNRVITKQSSDANTPSFAYYYNKDRLAYINRNSTGHLIFGYDVFGRLTYKLDLTVALYSSHVLSPAGRLMQITYPNDQIVNYAYDTLGRVSQVSTTSPDGVTTTLASNLAYQPFGPLHSFSFGNGQSYLVNADQAYRPTSQTSGPRSKSASYDPAGNLTDLNDANSSAQTFTYDALNELMGASDTQGGSYGNLGYTYLANGNRETETRNGVISTYTYANNRNRLIDTGSLYWLYDAAGNATWSNYAYVTGYDGYGRLTSANSGASTYDYNGLDQRIRKTASGVITNFHYGLTGDLLYETRGGGKAYIYLNGMPLARADNGIIYYYHTDHLGNPQQMTDSAGTTVWKAHTEPFGAATVTINTITNNLRLPGQYFDGETGLHYWGARYYDPKTGRGISADPTSVAEHVARWQSNMGSPTRLPLEINPYAYVANNPLRWIDPTGKAAIGGGGKVIPFPVPVPPAAPGAPSAPGASDVPGAEGSTSSSRSRENARERPKRCRQELCNNIGEYLLKRFRPGDVEYDPSRPGLALYRCDYLCPSGATFIRTLTLREGHGGCPTPLAGP